MTRRRLVSLVPAMATLAGVAIAVAWVSNADSGPVIQLPPGPPLNHIVEGFGYVEAPTHLVESDVMLCLSEPGSVKVVNVEPINPIGQIRVEDFGFRPNPFLTSPPGKMVGSFTGSLHQAGPTWSRNVDIACGAPNSGVGEEFAVELTNPTGTGAAASGWRITYESAGERRTFDLPIVFAACPGNGGDASCMELQRRADTARNS